MSADVVSPPGVAYVGCGSGEIRQILKGFPRDNSIAREANRISVGTNSCITGKNYGMLSVSSVIVIMVMVKRPEGIKSSPFGVNAQELILSNKLQEQTRLRLCMMPFRLLRAVALTY